LCDGFIIREAREEDLNEVIRINMVSLPEHYPYSFWRDHMLLWPKVFLVAEADSKIVGYVMTRIETGFGHIKFGIIKMGHIISIAVLPEYRRKGIGKSLMIEVMRRIKEFYNAKEVYLEVRISNEIAIKLYERLGFKKVRVLRLYYADGEDAYLMAREL
jgi:ribosomal-protein-alanine N-acetyltransferase